MKIDFIDFTSTTVCIRKNIWQINFLFLSIWHKPILAVVEYIYPFIVKTKSGAFATRLLHFPCSPSLKALFKSCRKYLPVLLLLLFVPVYRRFQLFLVISRRWLVATESSVLTYTLYSAASLKYNAADVIPHPGTLSCHIILTLVDQF